MTADAISTAGEIPLEGRFGDWIAAWRRGEPLGERIAGDLDFATLLDLVPSGDRQAVAGGAARGLRPLTYSHLRDFLAEGSPWNQLDVGPGERCAIAVPDGPELAVALLGLSMRCVVVPMNPWNPYGEINADLIESGARAIIVPVGADFDHIRRAARDCGATVLDLVRDEFDAGLFDLFASSRDRRAAPPRFNGADDVALELFTSGTSGRKKRVPIRLRDVCVGAACIAAALELAPSDRGYNMMPLFHVGGIVRNLFAPILSGSEMIYSDGFDPAAFWDQLDDGEQFTWYYASPTMHEGVLNEADQRPHSVHRLRFICNAAGDLLPSTAARLRARFDAAILPGYGMTECMPIAIPPLDYRLERKGASGRVLGPEVRIIDIDGNPAPTGTDGRIMLRGAPLARIVQDHPGPGEPPIPDGWFDTGDLGRFDQDGYLYILGRGKDVIKRGGETIAPAEIEDALVAHPDVKAALVFAVPHEALGETVGCVIVPCGGRRVDLDTLTSHLSGRLSSAKVPVLAVYMDALPRNAAGKLLRVKLAPRLGINSINETSPVRSRLLEAICPPVGAPLATPIVACNVAVSAEYVEAALRAVVPEVTDVRVEIDEKSGVIRAAVEASELNEPDLRERLACAVHDYLVPRSVTVLEKFPRRETGDVDERALSVLMTVSRSGAAPTDDVESHVLEAWRARLGSDRELDLDSDFFEDLGGGSLMAVQIIADLRAFYRIALPPTAIFRTRTVRALAALVRGELAALGAPNEQNESASGGFVGPAAKSQKSPLAVLTQLLPLAILPPALRVGQFACWILTWWYLRADLGLRGSWVMFAALGAAVAARNVVAPLVAIALKWTLIGRYRAGAAPLWGQKYLRWWLVRQFQRGLGLGIFSVSYDMTALYFRLMGARVGRRTRIAASADLGEFDLLSIGSGVIIDESAIVRPFLLEGGAMGMKPITLRDNVSIGTRGTVVPGSDLPMGTEVSPLGSSSNPRACNQGTRSLSRALVYAPPAWLKGVGMLIKSLLVGAAWVPVVLLMHSFLGTVITQTGHHGGPVGLLLRMMTPQRIVVTVVVLMVSTITASFIYMAGVILVKWTVIGRFRVTDDISRPWPMFERWLMWKLLPDGRFGGVAPIVGSNFAAISIIYRLLGAKVGKRIYWPGSGNVITEYDLFECGDDVTFGSRSTYLMTTADGSRPIRINAGANVADRCVLAPGVIVGRNAVLGSGTFAPEGFEAPAGSTWMGQDGPDAPIELEAATPRRAEAETLRPYARAMYQHETNYSLVPLIGHITINVLSAIVGALYSAAPMIGALLLTRSVLIGHGTSAPTTIHILLLLMVFYVPLQLVAALGALGYVISTKWLIVGRRVQGDHFWTDSSYCQRWKIHNSITSWTSNWAAGRDLLAFLEGSAMLVWFFRAQGAEIGTEVCLYPNGADPMMEEPDFVRIGDGACIDQAVLIAHLNTRGEWTMGPIDIGAETTLRASSRVMMMGAVGKRATLLESTLVLAGDASLPCSTWEGWPGQALSQ
ncbi:MAG: hypothetical protein NVS3B12_28350 [Acidimicrobiales bacterium]